MKHQFWPLAAFCLALGAAGCATVTDTGDWYRRSVESIDEGNPDFAAMYLKTILQTEPASPYAPQAAFALGEYYYDNHDYFQALKTLSKYIEDYPKDKAVVFAKLLIYKLINEFKLEEATSAQESALIKEIRKELFAQPLFLIFYDKKAPRSYKSLFRNTYLVYDYVDKIKVFRNGKIFLELTP
jgi:tetratricopeptide (TPR) repeat protein